MQAKRWLSGLVACAMLVTMLPTQVFALESDAADTWSKTLNAEELYALIQDKLDENGSIGLADLADSEAGTDTNDGVQGTLTAVAFDSGDKIELSALADGDTSYTLTFTDDDTSEPDSGLPAETGDMTEPPQEDGQPVAPGVTPADDSTASDTTSGTDPPTAEEPSAQGQEGTVDLRVTTQETYATEAEADAQAAEQGKDPEADVAVQTDEATGTVLGALLTVDEEQVDAITLYYTADETEDAPAAQPDNAISTMHRPDQPEYSGTYTINVGESETIEGYTGWNHQWEPGDSSVVSVSPKDNPNSATITGKSVGNATITHTYKGISGDVEQQFHVIVTPKEDEWIEFDVYYWAGEGYPPLLYGNGLAENYGPLGNDTPLLKMRINMTALQAIYEEEGVENGGIVYGKDREWPWGEDVYNGDGTWYMTYESCDEKNAEDWWVNVLKCADEESRQALENTSFANVFVGYVLKNQNAEGDYHLDGKLTKNPPLNVVELYLNGQPVDMIVTSEQEEIPPTKEDVRNAFEKKLGTEDVAWDGTEGNEGVIGTFTSDEGTTYYLIEGDNTPDQTLLGTEKIQFVPSQTQDQISKDLFVARFYLTTKKAPDPVTAGDVIGSFYKRLDMGKQSEREPYLEDAFADGDTFSFTLSKLEAKQDSNTEYEIAGAPVATATVTFNQQDILDSIGDNGTGTPPYHFEPLEVKNGAEKTLSNGYYILQEDFEEGSIVDNTNKELSWKNANGERKGEHGYIIHVNNNGEVTYKPNMEEDSVIINTVYAFKELEDTAPNKVYSKDDPRNAVKDSVEFNNVFENDFASYSVTYNWGQDYTVSGFELPAEKYYSEKATVTVANFENDVYATNGGQTYKFTGWKATTSNPDVAAPDISSGQFNMPAANVTLTAQWETVNTVNDLLAMFQKTVQVDEGSQQPTLPETFHFTLTQTKDDEGEPVSDVSYAATATVENANTPVSLIYDATASAAAQVLTGDISTEIPMLEDGEYTLTEDDISTPGWTKDNTVYTITITNGEMTVTDGTPDATSEKYLFTNTYFKPTAPTDLTGLGLTAKVDCTNETANHEPKTLDNLTGYVTFNDVTWDKEKNAWTTTAMIDTTAIASWYDDQVGATDHEVVTPDPEGDVREITLKWKANAWTVDGGKSQFIVSVFCEQLYTLTVKAVDEKNNALTVTGWPAAAENLVSETPYTVTIADSSSVSGAAITVPKVIQVDGTQYVYMEPQSGSSLTGTITDNTVVTLRYGIDQIGGKDPENPGDGIPDRYQFTIEYVVADGQEAMGTVSPVGKNVYTIYQDGVLSAGPVTVSIDGDVIKAGVATAQDGYVFENWTLNDVDLSAIGVDDDLTGYQMMGVTGGQTYTFIAHFTKNYTVQDVLYSFVKEVTLADGVENFPASAEFKFALTKEGGSPTYEATTGEVSGMTAERSIRIVTDATDILADGTYYLTETVMDAGWTLTTPADGYKITIDHGTMSVNDEQVTEGETFAFVNTYNGAPSLEVEKTVVDAEGNNVTDAVYRDGDPVYFKIAVTAKGGWPVEDVTVTDRLPAGLTVDAQAIQYPEFHNFRGSLTNVDGKTVEIRINTATPTEDTVWVIIPAIVDAPETYDEDAYTNIAVIDDGNLETEDPNGEATIRVAALDVQKTLVDNSKVYNVGDTVKYQITFKNIGNVTLKEFDIADAVPNGLEIVDSAWENGKFNDLLPDELQPGEEKAVTVEVRITDYSASYSNTATVTAETAPGGKPVTKDDTNTDLKVNPNHNVTVQYVLQDEAGKTVSAIDKGTLTAAHNSTWKVSVADQEDLTDAGNLQVPKTTTTNGIQYVFKKLENAQTSGTVTGNVEITVVYGLDEIGGGSDQKQPDGIPDEYQATVTYRVVNGTWSDGSSTDRTEVFTLYTYDPATAAWTEIEHVTLGNTIPTGMQANAGYAGQSGAWNTAITAETQVTGNVTYIYRFGEAAPDEIIVNYDDDGSGYGEVTSEHRQVFTADNWKTITDDPTHVRIHLTATAEDDGGRTYFDEWQGSLVDDLDDDIREDEELSAWVVAEIGQTYTVIADFGRRSSGGGGGGGNRDDDDDTEEIIDEEVPLAETPWLNTVDHYAYIVGYAEDGTVRPNANITRAEVATIFFRLLTDEARNSLWSTTNTFSDVASTAWYNTAVSTMANAGIIQGYEDGTFRPNANITRAEFAAIAARFMTSGYDVESDLFTDIAGHWARESINDAATAGWINGYSDDTFRPDNAITRAEAVTLVNNVLQRKPDADHMLDSMITWPDNPESAWYYEAIQEATNSHDYDMPSEDDDVDYETWTALQENRDWAALEAQWSAEHAYGGDVM